MVGGRQGLEAPILDQVEVPLYGPMLQAANVDVVLRESITEGKQTEAEVDQDIATEEHPDEQTSETEEASQQDESMEDIQEEMPEEETSHDREFPATGYQDLDLTDHRDGEEAVASRSWGWIKARYSGDVVILDMRGKLIGDRASYLNGFFRKEMKGYSKFILNLKEVSLMDATSLTLFVKMHSDFDKRDGKIALINAQKAIRDVLAITKADALLKEYDSEAEALESFRNME